jgi:hypothetical protein
MPSKLDQPLTAQVQPVSDAEPDVTWGRGGIDDWGWSTEPEPRPAATQIEMQT